MRHVGRSREHVGKRYDRKCGGKHDGKYDRKHNAIHSRFAVSLHRRDRRSIVGIDCRHSGSFWIGCFFNTVSNSRFDRHERTALEVNCGQKFRVEV
jgi:hypothetical protein